MGETVLCPFYMTKTWRGKNNNITITCDTIPNKIGVEVKNKLSFKTEGDRREWMRRFCNRGGSFKSCPYYQKLYGGTNGNC